MQRFNQYRRFQFYQKCQPHVKSVCASVCPFLPLNKKIRSEWTALICLLNKKHPISIALVDSRRDSSIRPGFMDTEVSVVRPFILFTAPLQVNTGGKQLLFLLRNN